MINNVISKTRINQLIQHLSKIQFIFYNWYWIWFYSVPVNRDKSMKNVLLWWLRTNCWSPQTASSVEDMASIDSAV